jgi:hypothetical protein
MKANKVSQNAINAVKMTSDRKKSDENISSEKQSLRTEDLQRFAVVCKGASHNQPPVLTPFSIAEHFSTL